MDTQVWAERNAARTDIAKKLTHLTRGNDWDDGYQNLMKILDEKVLIGSTPTTGFIYGNTPAVCFQDVPLQALVENLMFEKRLQREHHNKIRYSPFGIRFDKRYVFAHGGRPVIYEQKSQLSNILKPEDYWRLVGYDLSNPDAVVDWTHEREWRMPNNFYFEYGFIEIILPDENFYRRFISDCLTGGKQEMLQQIGGIVNLNSQIW